jgi:hypothetical protein
MTSRKNWLKIFLIIITKTAGLKFRSSS